MRKPLIVIEAPGKIETFRKILSGMGIYHAHIEATKGRIYDLPKDELGVSLNNFAIEKLDVINEKKFDYLNRHIENSSHVLIFTDSDIEGEVIGYHVGQLVDSDKPVYRCETQSLNEKGLMDALSNYREIDPKKVIAGLSRRAFDRILGYGCSTVNWSNPLDNLKGNVGRIITPIINKYYEDDITVGKLQRSVFLNDEEFLIDVDLKKEHFHRFNEIESIFSSIQPPSLREVSSSIDDDISLVPDSATFLSGISDSLEISIADANRIIEELYEDGDASYPRTDSFYLSEVTISEISALAEHFGIESFSGDLLKEKAEKMSRMKPSQEGHEAFHPLTDRINPFAPLSSYELKDQVMILLLRSVFRSGQENRKIITRNATLDICLLYTSPSPRD